MVVLQDRYEISESIGSGATSRVDKARDKVIGRTVALKTFVQGFGSRDLQQQFLNEAQIVGGLSHPNIVALYDVGTNPDGAPYLVMEYVEGKTLEATLEAGPLPLPRVGKWGGDLATALEQAHRAKIVHGDIKPDNILVTPDEQIKLGDFGVARLTTHITSKGEVLGTPAYLSPEQILGESQDTRSDIFSLGIVLYQMATGRRPFDGDSVGAVCAQIISSTPPPPSHHNPSLPAAFDEVVMRCLSRDPGKRFSTAGALAASLYPFARKSPATRASVATAKIPASRAPWWNSPFQRTDFWYLTAAILAVLASVGVFRAAHRHSGALPAASFAAATPAKDNLVPAAPAQPGSRSASLVLPTGSSSLGKNGSLPSQSSAGLQFAPIATTAKQERLLKPKSPARKPLPSAAPAANAPLANETQTDAAGHSGIPKNLAAAPATSLHIEIVSQVSDETLTVFAGDEVLLSTRLDPAKVGETIQFECPLAAGAHSLRVALYRPDDSLQLQKEGLAEIVAGNSNNLDIRVSRRARFLLRKDAALDVKWPIPHSQSAQDRSSPGMASTTSN